MPKISVIVPVYNSAKTIVRCLNSLINQTFSDMEIILVDDHGEDNSIEIAKNFIANHPKKSMFKFTETAVNSGPGVARNIGVHMAQGEYIAFVDSDDWVETDMYETLYQTAIQHSADLCLSDIFMNNITKNQQVTKANTFTKNGIFSDENKRNFLANFKIFFSTYLYRRELLMKFSIDFPPKKSDEDLCFLACSILCATRIAYCHKAFYHYAYEKNSLSHHPNSARYLDKLSSFDYLLAFAKKHHFYDDYKTELEYLYIKKAYLIAIVSYVANTRPPQVSAFWEIYKKLDLTFPDYAKNSLYRKHVLLRVLVVFLHRVPRLAGVVFYPVLRIFAKEKI